LIVRIPPSRLADPGTGGLPTAVDVQPVVPACRLTCAGTWVDWVAVPLRSVARAVIQ
jgi:hypothetical protein